VDIVLPAAGEVKSRLLASRANALDANVAALTAAATPIVAAIAISNERLFFSWFVVGLPVFLSELGWSFSAIGGFLALWVIFYGFIQAFVPEILRQSRSAPP